MTNPDVPSDISGLAKKLSEGAILITATKRLARESRRRFNLRQRDNGKQVWESPDILPFESWIYRLWQSLKEPLQFEGAETPGDVVLNPAQSREIWIGIIRQDIAQYERDTEPLWNVEATAKTAMEAWRICHEWIIDIEACEKSFLYDHRKFARWARSYQKQCRENNWVDGGQLINTIVDDLNVIADPNIPDLIFMGFDTFTAQQNRLIEVLQQKQVSVIQHEALKQNPVQKRHFEFDDEYEQCLAAASWAKQKLTENDQIRLAIVTPNLGKSRDIIDHAFAQILCPNQLTDPQTYAVAPYHISLGKALSTFPVVDAALMLLQLYSSRLVSYATVSKLLLSPFLAGSETEVQSRSRLEFWLRDKLPPEFRLSDLYETVTRWRSDTNAPVFEKMLCDACEVLDHIDRKQSYAQWCEHFLSWLKLFGWPGQRVLLSEEHQAQEAFGRELSNLGSLDLVSGMASASKAAACLLDRLTGQPFEPETAEVKIEVVGVLESTGLEFDAIWFGGLNENDWPPPTHKNPFIPGAIQRDRYYRASITANFKHAEIQHRRLINQAGEIVFSRHRFDGDVERHPSPLFKGKVEPHCEIGTILDRYQSAKPNLERFVDKVGLSVGEEYSSGGVSLIADQSGCPFRAYAKHRLGAYDVAPNTLGLNAAERGLLIHRILEAVWLKLESSDKAHATSDKVLLGIINQAITTQSKSYFKKSGRGTRFFEVQSQWLEQVLLEWFAVERTRKQPFRVIAAEKRQQLNIGGLLLNFKIDRIDQLSDGSIVLIDYKTGQTNTIKRWVGTRPQNPQLPLYALSLMMPDLNKAKVNFAALVFGKVKLGECTYQGISAEASFVDSTLGGRQIQALEKVGFDEDLKTWPELIRHWHSTLAALAENFRSGHAEVDPRDNDICMHCDLQQFCRIAEMSQRQ